MLLQSIFMVLFLKPHVCVDIPAFRVVRRFSAAVATAAQVTCMGASLRPLDRVHACVSPPPPPLSAAFFYRSLPPLSHHQAGKQMIRSTCLCGITPRVRGRPSCDFFLLFYFLEKGYLQSGSFSESGISVHASRSLSRPCTRQRRVASWGSRLRGAQQQQRRCLPVL